MSSDFEEGKKKPKGFNLAQSTSAL